MTQTRIEWDSIGEMAIPAFAAYGIQTARAHENLPISGFELRHFPALVNAMAAVKAATVIAVCEDIRAGQYHGHFAVDMIQGGAGT